MCIVVAALRTGAQGLGPHPPLAHAHFYPQVTEVRESDMRHEMDEVMARHVELKRKFKALYLAYRK